MIRNKLLRGRGFYITHTLIIYIHTPHLGGCWRIPPAPASFNQIKNGDESNLLHHEGRILGKSIHILSDIRKVRRTGAKHP
jgi:hypothetical protein